MRHSLPLILTLGLLAVPACTDPAMEQRLADLEEKVIDMEKELETTQKTVEELGKRPAAAPTPAGKPAAPPAASPEDEEKASAMLSEARELSLDLKATEARAKLVEMCTAYPGTRSCRGSEKLRKELEVFGRDAGELDVEKWYTAPGSYSDGKVTLLVWEVWCPHCKREVPALKETYEKFKGDGLQVIGLTKITKSATEEKVTAFIEENALPYPVGKENGKLSARFNVSGIPASAVVIDGKIVWRGHPARLTDEMLQEWLGLPTGG